jgi:hypothetical protein
MAGVGKETVPGVRGIYRLILNTLWGGVLSVYDKGYILDAPFLLQTVCCQVNERTRGR